MIYFSTIDGVTWLCHKVPFVTESFDTLVEAHFQCLVFFGSVSQPLKILFKKALERKILQKTVNQPYDLNIETFFMCWNVPYCVEKERNTSQNIWSLKVFQQSWSFQGYFMLSTIDNETIKTFVVRSTQRTLELWTSLYRLTAHCCMHMSNSSFVLSLTNVNNAISTEVLEICVKLFIQNWNKNTKRIFNKLKTQKLSCIIVV